MNWDRLANWLLIVVSAITLLLVIGWLAGGFDYHDMTGPAGIEVYP